MRRREFSSSSAISSLSVHGFLGDDGRAPPTEALEDTFLDPGAYRSVGRGASEPRPEILKETKSESLDTLECSES